MAVMEAVKVVPALREAAVLEPFAAIMALYESTTIAALETATSWSRAIKVAACIRSRTAAADEVAATALSWSRAIKVAACIRSGTAIGAAGEVAATARHCAGMATATAPPTTNTAATATAEGSTDAAAVAATANLRSFASFAGGSRQFTIKS
jgi:hypothetical protein